MNIVITDIFSVTSFWLVFSRLSATLVQLPLLATENIPNTVKVLVCFVLTYALYPLVKDPVMRDLAKIGVENFWLITIYYTLIGVVVGMLVKIMMDVVLSSTRFISQQIGFNAVSFFDPSLGGQVGPIDVLITHAMTLIILFSGAMLPMFQGMVSSFYSINLFGLGHLIQTPAFYLEFFKSIFHSTLLLSAPILFTNLIINFVMGILAKMVPQINILMVSFAVNIGAGLFVMILVNEEFFYTANQIFVEHLGRWFQFVR